jgi:AcrR family transcriptional regulator
MAKKNEKNDWIKVAFKILREKGIHEVRVESIARELNVTKGGFYGYFLNRDALLQSMLDHWETTLTDQIISKVSKIEGPLKDQLTGILSLVYKHVDEDIDKAMTAWSYKDQRARVVVNRVVRRRIDYMKGLFENAGFTSEQAELRARLMHSFVHGDRSFPDACEPRKSADRETIIQAFIELVCSPIES